MDNKFKGQGMALRDFRKENNLTIKEVAERMGHASMWLSDIEHGKKNIFFKDAKALCHIYGHTLDELSSLIDNYEK